MFLLGQNTECSSVQLLICRDHCLQGQCLYFMCEKAHHRMRITAGQSRLRSKVIKALVRAIEKKFLDASKHSLQYLYSNEAAYKKSCARSGKD